MSKDRNTFAKRQREVEKRNKADQKRARRAQRGQNSGASSESEIPSPLLSPAECSVLSVFRKCLMTPDKVLSFDQANLETFQVPLAKLAGKGLLVAQETPGAYSLTKTGFDAMKRGE